MIKFAEKNKAVLLIMGTIFIFFPVFILAQSQVDITVSAQVRNTSTTPVLYCGDNECNNGESCHTCPTDCGGCGGGIFISPDTKIIFKGQAYPFANVTIMKNDSVAASFKANADGTFEKQIMGLPSQTQIFSIFAEDNNGVLSAALSFTVPILKDRTTTVSGIFIPPTINSDYFFVYQGEAIKFFGQAFPESEVNILINPKEILKSSKSSLQGNWQYLLDTFGFAEGEYTAQARATDKNGKQSEFSKKIIFNIIKSRCKGPDLDFNGRVDLVDFSILLYFWNQERPANRCADINSDGIVNIIDFSIMMFWWTD